MSTKHQAAREWAQAGFHVFPCVPNGKEPAVEEGVYWATTDLAKIDEAWTRNPDFNIGVAPGPSGCTVIDIDGPHSLELPHTLTFTTPRGGKHLWYAGHCKNSVGTDKRGLAPKVDVRGDGGYVLLPPSSVHGSAYRLSVDADIADLPAWIPAKLERTTGKVEVAGKVQFDLPGNIARGIADVQALPFYRVDAGDNSDKHAFDAACHLVRDLALRPETALKIMQDHFKCEQKDEDWLIAKINSAIENGENAIGAYAVTADAFAHITPTAEPKPKRSRFYPEDEDEQDATPDPAWLVPNLIPQGGTVLLTGQMKSFKTFLALDIALAIASGQPTFGVQPTLAGPVMYGALEGRNVIKKSRRPAWKLARQIEDQRIPDFFVLPAPIIGFPGEMQEFGDQIKARLNGRAPVLIVLDTVAKCMTGLNENDAMDAGRFVRFCDSLVEGFGCAVLAIHHSGKEEGRGARGSSALAAGMETLLQVKAWTNTLAVEVSGRHKDAADIETPFTMQGHTVANSLAFFPTDAATHATLTRADDICGHTKIHAALTSLKAVGNGAGVSTEVLAATLSPDNDARPKIERLLRKKGRAAGELEAYYAADLKLWRIPHAA